MPLFRRKPADPVIADAAAAFVPVAAAVERAQRVLLQAVPTPRSDGVPLAEALLAFKGALDEARTSMPAWHAEALQDAWMACSQGIEEAGAEAERLRMHPGALSFEALNERIGDVLHPLERFAEVERSLRRGAYPRLA